MHRMIVDLTTLPDVSLIITRSVTRWLDYVFRIWPFKTIKIWPKTISAVGP